MWEGDPAGSMHKNGMRENMPHEVRYPWYSKLIGPNVLIYSLHPFDYAVNLIVVESAIGISSSMLTYNREVCA